MENIAKCCGVERFKYFCINVVRQKCKSYQLNFLRFIDKRLYIHLWTNKLLFEFQFVSLDVNKRRNEVIFFSEETFPFQVHAFFCYAKEILFEFNEIIAKCFLHSKRKEKDARKNFALDMKLCNIFGYFSGLDFCSWLRWENFLSLSHPKQIIMLISANIEAIGPKEKAVLKKGIMRRKKSTRFFELQCHFPENLLIQLIS